MSATFLPSRHFTEAPRAQSAVICIPVCLTLIACAACFLMSRADLLRFAVVTGVTITALVIYLRKTSAYIPFVLWVWFLAPLIRRMIDWRFGFVEPNIVLLAPLMASAISILALLKSTRHYRIPLIFKLCALGILYGAIVGVIRKPSWEVAFGLFTWLSPLLLGVHVNVALDSSTRSEPFLSRTFTYACLILGLYGVFQFVGPPPWDQFWLENVARDGLNLSFGRPDPFEIRVWSTLNSPGPFANVLVVAVLLMLQQRSRLKIPASIVGYVSIALSLVRTSWLSLILGLVLLLKRSNPRNVFRAVIVGVVLFLSLLFLKIDPRTSRVLGDRFGTLSDLSQDVSLNERLSMYSALTHQALTEPFGMGLQNLKMLSGTAVDSGILAMLYQLGWAGSLLFAGGVSTWLIGADRRPEMYSSRVVVLVLLAQLVGGNIFVGVNGALFWIFVGKTKRNNCVTSIPVPQPTG